MSEWWEKPYKGAPGVPVPGFPRPLYPKDVPKSSGYKPSSDGPDVEAYKRTISRLGRWPWQTFDRAYSNPFSHGKPPGNVSESGVEGFQRQQGIGGGNPTGWLGEKTFGALRCALVPEGLPHAGEHGMDALAQNLIAEAWQMFSGQQDGDVEFAESIREAALDLAVSQIGVHEDPPESNHTKYGAWYGVDYQPWCAIFVTWAFLTNAVGYSPSFLRGSRYAYVPYVVSDAQDHRYGLSITTSPGAGDLVCYDWSGGDYDHIGIFEKGNASSWTAIEGNTSTSNNSNGGQVMRRDRSKSQANKVAFVRVAEP